MDVVAVKYRKSNSPQNQKTEESHDQLTKLAGSINQSVQALTRASSRVRHAEFSRQALLRLERVQHELRLLGDGKLSYDSTETWRVVYEDVLAACKTKRYLSVAMVHTEDYWKGLPGERSIAFNGTLVQRGFYVHRMFVIDDFLWPRRAELPSKGLMNGMVAQFAQGIQIGVMRLSELESDRDLMVDFGIYGRVAVGYQTTDESGLTVKYEMCFGEPHVRLAEDRWKRLSLYTRPFESL